MLKVLDKKMKELKSRRDSLRNDSEKQMTEAAIENLNQLIRRIAVKKEPIGYANIMLYIQGATPEELNDRIKRVSSEVSIAGCSMKLLKFRQLEATKAIAPYGIPNYTEVSNVGERNMPISTLLGGYPMAADGIMDVTGVYLGKTKSGRFVILDQWLREKDRVNSNWFIAGMPGTGKSTFIKKILRYEYAKGTKIIIFDAEKEYIASAKDPDIMGDIVSGAGGAMGRINPLQIRKSPSPENGESREGDFYQWVDGEEEISDMALHIQNLRAFFQLYLGDAFTPQKRNLLEKLLIETYHKFNIEWDTDIDQLSNDQFPIMKDVYDHGQYMIENDSHLTAKQIDQLEELLGDLYSSAYGADQYLWNGPTTLSPTSDYIVIDTSSLLEADENVQNAQFFNLAVWGWHEMSKDRNQKVIMAVDEGYLYVDPQNPYLMKFFRNISKRDRKYEGSLMFITHSVTDVLDPAVKRLGQGIIDNACHKMFFGCDGKNLEELKNLFDLTEKEETSLASKTRGQGLMMSGATRLILNVDISEHLLEKFGKGGGR